jgi:hypothetical protein
VYYSTRKRRLVSVDVASYYPTLIASKGISPAAYGVTGSATYRTILERRLGLKRRSKEVEDADERKRLEAEAAGLKLVLNSTFGKFGSQWSSLFDLRALITVTISGQLMLIDLIERLSASGVRVLSCNTDGLFLSVGRADERWKGILREWQADTGMRLEVEPLKRLAILAGNRYATLDLRGKIKRRGAGVKGELSPFASPNHLVIADAVVSALLLDVPPERTVEGCRDPVRFCAVTRKSAKVRSAVLADRSSGTEIELGKVTRWYKSRDSGRDIVHRFDAGRHSTPSHATGVDLALDLVDGALPYDLDRAWYAAQARKQVQVVPGYRHRSRRLVQGNEQALAVYKLGLVPVPKIGKREVRGSDRKTPTLLWPWERYPTLGCYTGPAVAILVLDIDDPVLFRKAVDRGDFLLFRSRWSDFVGCLVACHGDVTAVAVRTGQGRGKLIFRVSGEQGESLKSIAVAHWKKSKGVEIFYGKGVPSILGLYAGDDHYRLDGTLTDAPEWLIEELTPRKRSSRREPSRNGQPHETVENSAEVLEGIPLELSLLAPELGRTQVGWESKILGDGGTIWVGRCPFPHESGRSSHGDLSAGVNGDGLPYVRCQHSSCEAILEINQRLKARYRSNSKPAVEIPNVDLTAIARTMLEDLESSAVVIHRASTGSGKTYSVGQMAAQRFRQAGPTIIAVPTLRLADEIEGRIGELGPDAKAVEAVAKVCGRKRSIDGEEVEVDANEDEDEPSSYPIEDRTMIAITTHRQFERREFSRYMRAIWPKLAPREEDENGNGPGRGAFAIVIDEVSAFIQGLKRDIVLASRYRETERPDRTSSRLDVLSDCPKSNRSGNCGNCHWSKLAGEQDWNPFGIRILRSPRRRTVKDGRILSVPAVPFEPDLHLFGLSGEKTRIGATTFAQAVVSYRGNVLDENERRIAPIYIFHGENEPESNEDVIGHMLAFAYKPVLVQEHPVKPNGEIITSGELQSRIERGDKEWSKEIVFPSQTCEVPRLRFYDLAPLEQLRRYALENEVGIVFAGAGVTDEEIEVLRTVFPDLHIRNHEYPPRKIKQVAVVMLKGHHGVDSLIERGRLLTEPLESRGPGLVFCPRKWQAIRLYEAVGDNQRSVRLVEGRRVGEFLSGSMHDLFSIESHEGRCAVTYSRGVLGLGANLEGLRFIVAFANAFRAIGSFNPSEITAEEFLRLQTEERLSLLLQNFGRGLRGEAGKTVVLFLFNGNEGLLDRIKNSRAIIEGSELPPVVVEGKDFRQLVDQSGRWLDAEGGEWPVVDPSQTSRKRRGGRPTKWTKESILAGVEPAIKAGMSWGKFARSRGIYRHLDPGEIEAIKGLFVPSQRGWELVVWT